VTAPTFPRPACRRCWPALGLPRPSPATRAAWEARGPSAATGPKGAKGKATAGMSCGMRSQAEGDKRIVSETHGKGRRPSILPETTRKRPGREFLYWFQPFARPTFRQIAYAFAPLLCCASTMTSGLNFVPAKPAIFQAAGPQLPRPPKRVSQSASAIRMAYIVAE
jgi:hypothetical protein